MEYLEGERVHLFYSFAKIFSVIFASLVRIRSPKKARQDRKRFDQIVSNYCAIIHGLNVIKAVACLYIDSTNIIFLIKFCILNSDCHSVITRLVLEKKILIFIINLLFCPFRNGRKHTYIIYAICI